MSLTIIKTTLSAAVIATAFAVSAQAATVTCVGTMRSFSIGTAPSSTCAAVAPVNGGNLSGTSSGPNADPLFALLGPGLIFLDTSQDFTSGTNPLALTGSPSLSTGTSGTFTFNIASLVASTGKQYFNFVLGIKSGGQVGSSSVWAAFALADGVSSGTWAITGAQQNISHMVLYAKERAAPAPVPLPAAGWLLISGFVGLTALQRRKRHLKI